MQAKQTQRHLEILDVLTRQGFVSTDDLRPILTSAPRPFAGILKMIRRTEQDPAPSRRGLIAFEHRQHRLQRPQGDAAKEKERIAREVAANIPRRLVLSSTSAPPQRPSPVPLLDHRELRIVTNNLNVG